jgi:hypothetical protein
LRQQAEYMEQSLGEIQKRIDTLEKDRAEKSG